MDYLYYAFFLLVTLAILVTFHEWGHFAVARRAGVHVVRFAVGFGKPILSLTDKRGTEFCVGVVPLGGYVRMYDRRDPDARQSAPADPSFGTSYDAVSPWWRIAIALAGPGANFVLALIVYWLLSVLGVNAAVPHVGMVAQDSPAYRAGIRGGDEIVAVDGAKTASWNDVALALAARLGETGVIDIETVRSGQPRSHQIQVSDWLSGVTDPNTVGELGIAIEPLAMIGAVIEGDPAMRGGLRPSDRVTHVDGEPVLLWRELVERIRDSAGEPLRMTVERDSGTAAVTVTPVEKMTEAGETIGYVGAQVGMPSRVVRYGPVEAIGRAASETWSKTLLTFDLVRKMVTGSVSPANLAGPLSIAIVTGEEARAGLGRFLSILALLSISFGVLNVLPIPVLDGGHVVYSALEIIRSKPISLRTQAVASQIGLAVVVAIMVFVFYVDITRWWPGL